MMSSDLQVLEWDTNFFGFGVCKLQVEHASCVEQAVARARAAGMRLAYWFVDPADADAPRMAKAIGATLVDQKVTYLSELARATPAALDARIERATEVSGQLRALAIQSGQHSRYKIDPNFGQDAFERMYTIWLERAVDGAIAREVLVYREGGRELGFVTAGVKNGRANIGLIAVDAGARSKGIGVHLVNAALSKAKQWGVDQMDVVTQKDNGGACRFYERCGFTQEKVEHIYHVWL